LLGGAAGTWPEVALLSGVFARYALATFGSERKVPMEKLQLIETIDKAGAAFRSLGDPLWDTSSPQGRLLSTLLAAIAEFERELIRERTGEGRKRALASGIKFGRKPKLSQYQRAEALKRRDAGETLASIARSYAVDVSMISRLRAQDAPGS
jgi:DNA invertase Pin-like site-specific DNA recombinase